MDQLLSYVREVPFPMSNSQRSRVLTRLNEILQEPGVIADLNHLSTSQRTQEDRLLSRSPCTENMGEIYDTLFGLQPRTLQEVVSRNFYNRDVMKAITCITNAIIEQKNSGTIPYFQRILRWISALHQIGVNEQPTIGGIALQADLEEVKGLYVFKIPRPGAASLRHEYLVGVLATNRLRNFVPNYAYIYGYFKCAPPLLNLQGNSLGWCTNNTGPGYLVYENISPARSMYEAVSQTSLPLNRYLSYLLQVILALRVGIIEADFTHYDLHTRNVLLREVPGMNLFQIPYETAYGRRYILTDRVATFIDYGYSHFKYQNNHFGSYGLEEYLILPNQSNALYDIYKFLLFSIRETPVSDRTPQFMDIATRLVRFFNTTNSLDEILTQRTSYFALPVLRPSLSSLDNFLTYFIEQVPRISDIFTDTPQSRYPILNCRNLNCETYPQVLRSVGLSSNKYPTTLFDAYDAINRVRDAMEAARIKNGFPYSRVAAQEVDIFNRKKLRFNTELTTFLTITLRQAADRISEAARESANTLFEQGDLNSNELLSDLRLTRIGDWDIIRIRGTHSLYRLKIELLVNLYYRYIKLLTHLHVFEDMGVMYSDTIYAPQVSLNISPSFANIFIQDLRNDEKFLDSAPEEVRVLFEDYPQLYDAYTRGIFIALEILHR